MCSNFNAGPGMTGAIHVDRTTSPSVASVTSGYSATSSVAGGAGSLRKNLEWDITADLRPGEAWVQGEEVISTQREAANNLGKLDQMVIETYSNYFPRGDPEGKPSKKPVVASSRTAAGKIKRSLFKILF